MQILVNTWPHPKWESLEVRIQVILADSDSLWHAEIWAGNTWLWWRCCWGLRLISPCLYMSSCRRGVQAQPLSVGYCEQEFEQIWASNPGTKEGTGPRRVMVGPGSHCFPAGGRSPLPTCHCLERTGLVLCWRSIKSDGDIFQPWTWIICVKKCGWPWGGKAGELPGLESAPEWWGSAGPSQVGFSICPWRDLVSWRLRMKPIAFVLSYLSTLTYSPDTYPYPLDTSLQVGRSLRPPWLLYIKTYRGSKKFWQLWGLQTLPGHRIALPHACSHPSPKAFLLLWVSCYFNLMQPLFKCYRTHIMVLALW